LYAIPTVPIGNNVALIITGASPVVMENCLVSFPTELAALTVKVDVPFTIGVPEITPVVGARLNPTGNAPLSRLHVMGVVPVAVSVCLYVLSSSPPGNVAMVIVGATGGAIVMENCFVLYPPVFVALTVNVDVPSAVGLPEIAPLPARLKPSGNAPLSRLHVMGVVPVAVNA
jgi:hypothetical protein